MTRDTHGLAGRALAAAAVANAVRPFDRRGRFSAASFLFGWPVSEFPAAALAADLAVTGLRSRRSWASLVAAADVVGLAGLIGSARQAEHVYEDALRAQLGPDYRHHVRHPDFPGADVPPAKAGGIARTALIRRRLVRDHDISYGPAGGRANLLDVWSRDDLPLNGRAPVLLQIPGGAWVIGSKRQQAYPLLSHVVERGWVAVAINYRLAPKHAWPAHIVDVKRAIAWVRANIARYGGNPDFVAVTGGSAGGHLTALAALTPNDPAYQPGFAELDTSVQAALPWYGVYDLVNATGEGQRGLHEFLARRVFQTHDRAPFDAASPTQRVNADAPPFFVSHGSNDSIVPVEQARTFARRLGEVSHRPVVWAELPGAQHAFDLLGTARTTAAVTAAGRFLCH